MALFKRPLIQEHDFGKVHKNYEAAHVQQCVFAARGGLAAITKTETLIEDLNSTTTPSGQGDMWPELTPVYFDSTAGFWKIWTQGAGNPIEGFKLSQEGLSQDLYGRGRMIDDMESMHRVLLGGQVDADDVYLPPGETLANLQAALSSTTRANNINVYNLPATAPFH